MPETNTKEKPLAVENAAETKKRRARRTMQEQLLDIEADKKRLIAKAKADCVKRAQVASELLALNITLLGEGFMVVAVSTEVSVALSSAKKEIERAIAILSKA
jgi:hypothetical protein